jgi:polyisoprenoid-binding protein YceI
MILSHRCAVFAISALIACSVQAQDWNMQPEGSSLRFKGKAQGESFEGRFAQFKPGIRFDPAALEQARFDVSIALISADSQNEERDSTMKSADFFDVENYPEARFIATEFAADGDAFLANGALELRGTRQPVTLRFTWKPDANGARLDGKATLDRTAFGVGGGDWADPESIAHEVSVETTLILAPSAPTPTQ